MSFASLTPFLGVSYMEVESVSRARSGDNQDKRPRRTHEIQVAHLIAQSEQWSISNDFISNGKLYNHMRVEIPPLAR